MNVPLSTQAVSNRAAREKPMAPPARNRDELRGLDQILSMLDNGDYLPQLISDLEKLNIEMKDFSQAFGCKSKGQITITLALTNDRFGQIEMTANHAVKVPKAPAAKAILWTTADGQMTPSNPNQTRMEIRDIGGGRSLVPSDDR